MIMLAAGGCATSPQGRTQITAPTPVSNVYSSMNMNLTLATAPGIQKTCNTEQCMSNLKFDDRVQALGVRLASAAFHLYPDLTNRVSHFDFNIAAKSDIGTTSSGSGKIVIYRGTQSLELSDESLAFLLAREMGHVIARHHEENSGTRIMFSVLAGLLFPALNLFTSSAAAAQATSITSATTLTTTAASTATSFVGSEVVLANIKPSQLTEADAIALDLLDYSGWNHESVAHALETNLVLNGKDAWSEDLRESVRHVVAITVAETSASLILGDKTSTTQGDMSNGSPVGSPFDAMVESTETDSAEHLAATIQVAENSAIEADVTPTPETKLDNAQAIQPETLTTSQEDMPNRGMTPPLNQSKAPSELASKTKFASSARPKTRPVKPVKTPSGTRSPAFKKPISTEKPPTHGVKPPVRQTKKTTGKGAASSAKKPAQNKTAAKPSQPNKNPVKPQNTKPG